MLARFSRSCSGMNGSTFPCNTESPARRSDTSVSRRLSPSYCLQLPMSSRASPPSSLSGGAQASRKTGPGSKPLNNRMLQQPSAASSCALGPEIRLSTKLPKLAVPTERRSLDRRRLACMSASRNLGFNSFRGTGKAPCAGLVAPI